MWLGSKKHKWTCYRLEILILSEIGNEWGQELEQGSEVALGHVCDGLIDLEFESLDWGYEEMVRFLSDI